MADRLIVIKQCARSLRMQSANVSESYQTPDIEDDMEQMSMSIWGGRPVTPEEELACEP